MSAGGSVQKGETPVEGAIRELKEETGINVSEMTELFKFVNDPHNSIHFAFMCEKCRITQYLVVSCGIVSARKKAEKKGGCNFL